MLWPPPCNAEDHGKNADSIGRINHALFILGVMTPSPLTSCVENQDLRGKVLRTIRATVWNEKGWGGFEWGRKILHLWTTQWIKHLSTGQSIMFLGSSFLIDENHLDVIYKKEYQTSRWMDSRYLVWNKDPMLVFPNVVRDDEKTFIPTIRGGVCYRTFMNSLRSDISFISNFFMVLSTFKGFWEFDKYHACSW